MKHVIKIFVATLLMLYVQQAVCAEPGGFPPITLNPIKFERIDIGIHPNSLLSLAGFAGSLVSIKFFYDGAQKRIEENKDCAECQQKNASQTKESTQLFTYGGLLLVGSLAAIFNGPLISFINGK